MPMWGGTMVLTPLFSVAGLNEDEAVWPFTTGSVSTISRVTRCGSSMDEGVALEGLDEHFHAIDGDRRPDRRRRPWKQ